MSPIVVHPESRILAGISDATSQLRDYWAAEVQHKSPFTFQHDALTGAPEGRTFAPAISYANAAQPAFVWTFKGLFGLIGAWNLFLLLGFFLTGFISFVFLDSLGLTFFACLFGSYVIAFNPWNFERALSGHIAFLHEWVFVVLTAALLYWRKRGTLVAALIPAAGLALCFYMAAYFGLFASFLTFVFFAIAVATARPVSRLRATASAGVVYGGAIFLLLPTLVLYEHEHAAVAAIATHASAQLSSYGASVWAYITPYYRHPFLSGITTAVAKPGSFTEQTLFFGYSTMLLAGLCAVLVVRKDPWIRTAARWPLALLATFLVPLAFITSLPSKSHVFGVTLPMPALFIGHITTYWRVYARFGILVGFGLAILAAFSITYLTQQRGWRWIGPAAFLVLAGIEFLPGSIPSFSTTARPDYIAWLANAPRGIVATYPPALDQGPGIDLASQQYWYQSLDGQPLFAYFGPGTIDTPQNAVRLLARYVTDPLTPSILATEHVRYVVVHDDVYRAENAPPPVLSPKHFHLIKRFPNVRIFSVTAPHVNLFSLVASHQAEISEVQGSDPVTVGYAGGFDNPELYQGETRRWMTTSGTLSISNDFYAGGTKAELQTLAFSNAAPRTVSLETSSGKTIASAVVPTYQVTLTLGPVTLPKGTMTLRLVSNPPATQLGANDPRLGSVYLGPIQVIPTSSPEQP